MIVWYFLIILAYSLYIIFKEKNTLKIYTKRYKKIGDKFNYFIDISVNFFMKNKLFQMIMNKNEKVGEYLIVIYYVFLALIGIVIWFFVPMIFTRWLVYEVNKGTMAGGMTEYEDEINIDMKDVEIKIVDYTNANEYQDK